MKHCFRCGKEFSSSSSTGDLCSECDVTVNSNTTPLINSLAWICPVCGRGVSPYVKTCPCKDTVVKWG